MSNYAIIANGPFINEMLIRNAIKDHTVIALDGAANHLRVLSIAPDVILGDFDSLDTESQNYWGILKTFSQLNAEDKPYMGKHQVRIVPMLDQNFTDLEKAIHYCDQHLTQRITLLCATGGREDQHEGMKIALKETYQPCRPIIVHTDQQTLRYAQDESIQFEGQPGDYCGFIAVNTGVCTTNGLTYECQDAAYSVCNRLKAHTATIHVKGGALIIMPLQLSLS